MPGLVRIRLTQLSGAVKRRSVRGSRSSTWRPGSRTCDGSGAGKGCIPQPASRARTTTALRSRARMRPKIDVLQVVRRQVRVELGRGNVGVTEHLLDRAQVAAAREQVRREGVA